MHVGLASFEKNDINKILCDTTKEGILNSPIEYRYEIERRFEPLGFQNKYVDRLVYGPEIKATFYAQPGSIGEVIIRRMGQNSDAQNVKHVRRVVEDWHTEAGVDQCLIDVTKLGGVTFRFRLWISKDKSPVIKPTLITSVSGPGGGCFYQTTAGWSVNKTRCASEVRIASVAKQIIAASCVTSP